MKKHYATFHKYILPKTNIAPEHRPSPKEISIPTIRFQVQTVGFREGTFILYKDMGVEPKIMGFPPKSFIKKSGGSMK